MVIESSEGREVAQRIFEHCGDDFLLRVVYRREEDIIKVITVYWTSKINKYLEGYDESKV